MEVFNYTNYDSTEIVEVSFRGDDTILHYVKTATLKPADGSAASIVVTADEHYCRFPRGTPEPKWAILVDGHYRPIKSPEVPTNVQLSWIRRTQPVKQLVNRPMFKKRKNYSEFKIVDSIH